MGADHAPARAERAMSRRSCSRTSSPRPRIGARRSSSSGSARKMRSISSSTVAVSSPSDSTLGSSGAKAGSLGSEPSAGVHRAGHLAEPRKPVEEALRRRRRARRARAPSRRPRRRRTPGGARASRSAVRRSSSYQPPSAAMFGKPCSLRKRSSSSSGLMPASSRRKTLRISASSKTIEVFDCSDETRAARRRARGRARRSPRPAGTRLRPARPAPVDPARISAHELARQRSDPRRGRRTGRRRRRPRTAAGRGRACPCRSAPRRARARAAGSACRERDGVEDLGVRDGPRLRAEPALRGDELDERALVRPSLRPAPAVCSWNQKNPRGASVRRYGSSPIGGKAVRPSISTGTIPAIAPRGRAPPPAPSGRGCGRRARCRPPTCGCGRRCACSRRGAARRCRGRRRGAPCAAR